MGVLHYNFFLLAVCLLLLMNSVWYYTLQNKGFPGILMVTICILLTVGQVVVMLR
ncbi:hypothetical protein SAMN05421687_10452 [Salimicrobium flavidum]|uniref:Uncharacterized protein n=1 Tax=Salimicrobium flavidum TaxID=570947 RepID=A0A1N7J743_9BACI|nr:hypothetical protein SAMN05421687_10452 [Salimicrobium flavidum]